MHVRTNRCRNMIPRTSVQAVAIRKNYSALPSPFELESLGSATPYAPGTKHSSVDRTRAQRNDYTRGSCEGHCNGKRYLMQII